MKCCDNGKHWLAELWGWPDASCVQSPHFDFILSLLSYGFGFHIQDKFNLLIQAAVHFNVPLDIHQSNEMGIWPGQ